MQPHHIQIGQTLRYGRDRDTDKATVGEHVNFWHATQCPGAASAQLEKGINPIAPVTTAFGRRRPAVLISSSPHRVGSTDTPWNDIFDPDNGHIRYFGDAKRPGVDPAEAPGNKLLLAMHGVHTAVETEARRAAVPILFFRRTTVAGVRKGFVQFQGLGVIERAERITQVAPRIEGSFTNYVYDIAVLALADENELFDWRWINQRRDGRLDDVECLTLAPAAWKRWLMAGPAAVARNRRHVSKLQITRRQDQLPEPGSRISTALEDILRFYAPQRHRFEGLAYAVTRKLLHSTGGQFTEGWITPASGDGGADFIARLDVGRGFGAVRQIVYGQAKCVGLTAGVDGKDIARTVARLKRGWFGVFVTTSYFSEPVQREVIEDEYPILLVSGKIVAETAYLLAQEQGCASVSEYLKLIDADFEGLKAHRRPEEVLHA
jgi:hypothetical protein